MKQGWEFTRRGDVMAILEWEKRFEIGQKQFDEHHKRLVALLNQTYDNLMDGASQEALESIIAELADYAVYHFKAEESSMASYGYADLPVHQEEHKKFNLMVAAFQENLKEGRHDLAVDVLSFLGNWLFDHILETDLKYCHFIEQRQTGRKPGTP
jgi:hemerythrin